MRNLVIVSVLLLAGPFFLVGCGDKTPPTTDGGKSEQPATASDTKPEQSAEQAKDIVDTAAANDDFKTLVAAVKAAGLVETLKGAGPFTVFAPRTPLSAICQKVRWTSCSSLRTRTS